MPGSDIGRTNDGRRPVTLLKRIRADIENVMRVPLASLRQGVSERQLIVHGVALKRLIRPQSYRDVFILLNKLRLASLIFFFMQRWGGIPILRVGLLRKERHLFTQIRNMLRVFLLFLVAHWQIFYEVPNRFREFPFQRLVSRINEIRDETADIALAMRFLIEIPDGRELRFILVPVPDLICR